MSWISFAGGVVSVLFAYALFSSDKTEEIEADPDEGNLIVNDFFGRYVTLSCQTCRKLKRHKEIEPNLYECTKCQRLVDLRRVG